ncbi:tetratricopeptide repeat protein [Lysinibacillus piscis]|uniref:TPR repeat-containing protein YrrB n=1 Tax=Lysinibacillus piscis TaxID=2518931 RepID=A0ABQ5NJE5_9BACI|nr:tetratricopeptide repeat protein [Lysinibacillus sp. KH24]GLC88497.1 TPR repeat-containing protein YrrB [Lysinibacillus sp. KH24]
MKDFNILGIEALQDKRYEDAAQLFTQAIEAEPEKAIGYVNFGNLLAVLDDTERAERFFQKAITVDETAATAYYGLANLYFNLERYAEAIKLYEKALQYQIEGADVYYMMGKCLERLEQPKLALPYLQRATELAPEDVQSRLAYAIVLCALEMFDEGKQQLNYLIEQDWNNADAHYNLGVLYAVSTEQTEDAMYHLKQAFTLQPEYDQARYIYDMIAQRFN